MRIRIWIRIPFDPLIYADPESYILLICVSGSAKVESWIRIRICIMVPSVFRILIGLDTHKIKIRISVSVLFVGACPQQVVRRGGLVARDDHTSIAPKTVPVRSY